MPTKKEKQPLSVTHPELAREADGWDPSMFTFGSNKKQNWKCKKGHNWVETPNRRSNRSFGCPFCSGQRVLKGFNDLKTTHPDIAKQAFNWDPTSVSAGSNQKLEWICSERHTWETTVGHRTNSKATGCPVCSGHKIVPGINDLYSLFQSVALEADGWDPKLISPGSNKSYKWKCRDGHSWSAVVISRTLLNTGCPVCANLKIVLGVNDLTTTHPELAKDADGWDPTKIGPGTDKKMNWKCNKGHKYEAQVNKRTKRNQGCPVCANKRIIQGVNDLATTHPELAKEAYGWEPSKINAGRGVNKVWKCSEGHIWSATPVNRTSHNSGCPVCSGNLLLIGFNDLATTHPELAKEAFGWDPTLFVASGTKKLKWKCSVGHTWSQRISERKSGSGCPSCARTGFDPNIGGYLYFIANERWQMLQIGITNVPDDRLSKHSRLGWELLELRGPMDGHLTQQWETAILRMLKAKGADLSNSKIAGKFDGYSEAWSKSTFEVKTIKELMKLTEEFEEKH